MRRRVGDAPTRRAVAHAVRTREPEGRTGPSTSWLLRVVGDSVVIGATAPLLRCEQPRRSWLTPPMAA